MRDKELQVALIAVLGPSDRSASCQTRASVKVATEKADKSLRESVLVVDLCTSSDFVVNEKAFH